MVRQIRQWPERPGIGLRSFFMIAFDVRRDTRQAAAFLSERGYRVAAATLNKMRCVGGGPDFELFGRRPVYREKSLLDWAQARTTHVLRSTSDPAASTAPSLATPVQDHTLEPRQSRHRNHPRNPVSTP
jgi:hypothetical protein